MSGICLEDSGGAVKVTLRPSRIICLDVKPIVSNRRIRSLARFCVTIVVNINQNIASMDRSLFLRVIKNLKLKHGR